MLEQGLGDPVVAAAVAAELKPVTLSSGDDLVRAGDEEDGFYIVAKGSLSAWIAADRSEVRVTKFLPGALIGELSGYLADQRRSATVRADTDCELHHLSRATWRRMETESPALSGQVRRLLAATLADRMISMNKRMMVHE